MQRERIPTLVSIAMAVVLLFCAQAVFAQLRIVGSISGTVQDPTGAVVSGAQVILKDTKTALTKETVSNDGGAFVFLDLAAGVYEVTVTKEGFQKSLIQNINVSTSQTTDVKVNLEV